MIKSLRKMMLVIGIVGADFLRQNISSHNFFHISYRFKSLSASCSIKANNLIRVLYCVKVLSMHYEAFFAAGQSIPETILATKTAKARAGPQLFTARFTVCTKLWLFLF
jgi:hypothetical protein